MKRIFLACASLFALLGAAAQDSSYMLPAGVSMQDGRVVIENPTTTLVVDLAVEKEVVLSGPYARYAQKFFGVRAPLSDKTTYVLTSGSVALATAVQPANKQKIRGVGRWKVLSHSRADSEFPRIQADKVDATTLPLEDAAREAANTIFSLRKHRIDLITGEAGEHVFGEGLKAALNEIERLEQGYLELFFGKRIVSTENRSFRVQPVEGKLQYILCRFSVDQGVVSDTDLSGEIVLLQIQPSGNTPCPYEADRKSSNVVTYRIADVSECVVSCGGKELAKSRLPIFEFGRTAKISMPVSKR